MLCVGYRGDQIEARIGGPVRGRASQYSHDAPELDGTLGAVRRALPLLGERFLVLYGDTYLRLDYRAVAGAWPRAGCPALMTVLRNDGRWDASNVGVPRPPRGAPTTSGERSREHALDRYGSVA